MREGNKIKKPTNRVKGKRVLTRFSGVVEERKERQLELANYAIGVPH